MKTKTKKRIRNVCLTLLLLFSSWSLFYHFGIPDKRFVQSGSANESKHRKALIAEYLPSKDTVELYTFILVLKEFFIERQMIAKGTDDVRLIEGTFHERLIYDLPAKKDTSKKHLKERNNWKARLETWSKGEALHGRIGPAPDTLLLIFREFRYLHDSDTIWLYRLK